MMGGSYKLDEPLPSTSRGREKVIVLFPEQEDFTEQEWLRGALSSGTFDFLNDPAEDIYTSQNGKPSVSSR
jgi:hypothetical protein